MKRLTISIILSLVVGSMTSVCWGQHRGNNLNGNGRPGTHKEMTGPNRPGKGGNSLSRPGSGQIPQSPNKPTPNSHKRPEPKPVQTRPGAIHPVGHVIPDPLSEMVRYSVGSGQFVDLWQISNNEYILKYKKGNRYYTRRLYPYSCQYGPISSISINWRPSQYLSVIPTFQLNINL